MDGRGRALDNVFVERLWRSVKYKEAYLRDYTGGREAQSRWGADFRFVNHERPHQSLGDRTPAELYGVRSSSRQRRHTTDINGKSRDSRGKIQQRSSVTR